METLKYVQYLCNKLPEAYDHIWPPTIENMVNYHHTREYSCQLPSGWWFLYYYNHYNYHITILPYYHITITGGNMGLSENRIYSQWNSHLIGIMIRNDQQNHWVNGVTIPYECQFPAMFLWPTFSTTAPRVRRSLRCRSLPSSSGHWSACGGSFQKKLGFWWFLMISDDFWWFLMIFDDFGWFWLEVLAEQHELGFWRVWGYCKLGFWFFRLTQQTNKGSGWFL